MSSRYDGDGDSEKTAMLPVESGSERFYPKKGNKRALRNAAGPDVEDSSVGQARRQPSRKTFRLWVKVALIFLIVGMIGGICGVGVLASWMAEAPPLRSSFKFSSSTMIFDINDKPYQELESIEKRIPVTIDDIPEMVQLCFVSMEDQRFYDHFGVDIRGTAKAIVNVLTTGTVEGPGGSTITQQLIKLTHLSAEKQLQRKAQEWKLAYQLEKKLSKRQIIEAYLNVANFSQTWGIQSASRLFFGKDVSGISLAQAACLTAIVNLPNVYNPYAYDVDENGDRSISRVVNDKGKLVRLNYNPANKERASLVVAKMLELGNITQREYDQAIYDLENNEIGLKLPESLSTYTYFTDACYNAVIKDMQEIGFTTRQLASQELLQGGYTIHSTVDPTIQKALEEEAQNNSNFPAQTSTAKTVSKLITNHTGVETNLIPQLGGAIVQNSTGYVVAMIGGRGEKKGNLELNRAIKTFQTGSTTKPITVYAPGFETGALTLATTFDNVKIDFSGAGFKGFIPTNSPNVYTGMTTCRQAIRDSINIVAVQAYLKVGYETSIEYGEKFGFEFVKSGPATDTGPGALALGGYTDGQTPLALASAFSTFANGGYRMEPVLYTSVTGPDGQVLVTPNQKKIEVISPEAAFITTDALQDVVRGGTTTISIPGQQIGGKTGTTSDSASVLFAGFTKEYSGAFWFGYDRLVYKDPETKRTYELLINTSSGYNRSPAQLWEKVFRKFYDKKNLPSAKLPSKPTNVITAAVDTVSGKKPTELSYADPRGSQVRSEYFIQDTYPGQLDDIHVTRQCCSISGQLATAYCPAFNKICLDKSDSKTYQFGQSPVGDNYPGSEATLAVPSAYCILHNGYGPSPGDSFDDLIDIDPDWGGNSGGAEEGGDQPGGGGGDLPAGFL
jgi:penicillin-binding protein 1A